MLCKQACNDNEVSIYAYTNLSYEKHYSSLSIMYWHNIMVFCKVIHIHVSKRLSGFDIKKVGNGVPRGGLSKNGFGLYNGDAIWRVCDFFMLVFQKTPLPSCFSIWSWLTIPMSFLHWPSDLMMYFLHIKFQTCTCQTTNMYISRFHV